MDTQSLYREELLEHYRNPQNFGRPKTFDLSSRQLNPFCGDEIEIFVKFISTSEGAKLDHLEGVSFEGRGCAISIAAASMLTEYAKGKTKKELTKFYPRDMLNLLGLEVSGTRKKCALLALAVLKDCL